MDRSTRSRSGAALVNARRRRRHTGPMRVGTGIAEYGEVARAGSILIDEQCQISFAITVIVAGEHLYTGIIAPSGQVLDADARERLAGSPIQNLYDFSG